MSDSSDIVCPNKCYVFVEYEIDNNESIYTFKIFRDSRFEYTTQNTQDTKDIALDRIREAIKYWKDNDRYLTKLMGV
jgi:hypothetical protein